MRDGMDGHGYHGRGRGHGRGGGGGGRVFGPGDLRLVLLSLLAEQPRHGYELIKAIEGLFDGTYSPSPGSVYPTLTLLEELGQIAPVETAGGDGGRKPLALTEAGRAWIAENADAMELAVSRMRFAARAMAKRNVPDGVIQSMHMLKAALAFHPTEWTDAEVARVRGVLDAAVKQITG